MNKKTIIKLSQELLQALVIVAFFYFFLFPVNVTGVSMMDTLCDGDKVLASRAAAVFDMYDTDDVVIIKFNHNGENIRIVKRIAAEEGDSISINNGNLYINGSLKEGIFVDKERYEEYILEKGQIFVLGDNAKESIDSRDFGPFDKGDVESRVFVKVYPFDSIERL